MFLGSRISLLSSVSEFSSVSFSFFLLNMCHLSGLSGVRAHTALIKACQLSVIHAAVLFCFCCFFPCLLLGS